MTYSSSPNSITTMDLQQKVLIDIVRVVDSYCNNHYYLNLTNDEVYTAILDNPYCWKLVENKFANSSVESKKKEILNTLESKFSVKFPNTLKKLLLDNSFCTFEELELAIDLVKF